MRDAWSSSCEVPAWAPISGTYETMPLAAPDAQGPSVGADQHEADPGAPRDLVHRAGKAPVDPLDAEGLRPLEEVHERVGPGGHDADAVVLADRPEAAQDEGEVVLEVVHEALQQARRPACAKCREPPRHPPRAAGGLLRLAPALRVEVVEQGLLDGPAA